MGQRERPHHGAARAGSDSTAGCSSNAHSSTSGGNFWSPVDRDFRFTPSIARPVDGEARGAPGDRDYMLQMWLNGVEGLLQFREMAFLGLGHVHRPVLRGHSWPRRRRGAGAAHAVNLRARTVHRAGTFRRCHGRRTDGRLDHGDSVEYARFGAQCSDRHRWLSARPAGQSGTRHRRGGQRKCHWRHHRHDLGAGHSSDRQGHRSAVRPSGIFPARASRTGHRIDDLARQIAPRPDHRRVRAYGRLHRLQ